MPHDEPLITTIVVGLCLAFLFGIIANRLRISPLVGYLLAGVLVGPHTGGFSADPELTDELAKIGIILLMFGVGLHFSLKDLLSVKAIALPGAIAQMTLATFLGFSLGWLMGWNTGASLIFGLSLSTASTVVLLRAMQERRLIETERGRITMGWLIVEDIAMVFALVLVPALAGVLGGHENSYPDPIANWLNVGIWGIIALTLVKVILFIAVMLVVGRHVIPWILKITAQSGSRELFRLGVLAIALGVAFGAVQLFGVSLALGAFFAGMIMSESELSHRAAEETLPLRDAFAVLFFVSVGMLFDPFKLWTNFFPLLATLSIIIIGKSTAAFLLVRLFRHSNGTAFTISASLAQIGEFSFILATLATSLGILQNDACDLIVGSAILSILLNPLVFIVTEKIKTRLEHNQQSANDPNSILDIDPDELLEEIFVSSQTGHTIVIGYGRIGEKVTSLLHQANTPLVIIEDSLRIRQKIAIDNADIIAGNGIDEKTLEAANIKAATKLVVTIRNTFETGQIVASARRINPTLVIVAHAIADAETKYLLDLGTDIVVTDDQEIANGMIEYLLGKRDMNIVRPQANEQKARQKGNSPRETA